MDVLGAGEAPSPVATGLTAFNIDEYRMQPRINLRRDLVSTSHLQPRDKEKCKSTEDSDTCEKPVGPSATTIPIVLGIVIPVVVAICVLLFLHRRNMRKLRAEDAQADLDLDYGLNEAPARKGKQRKSLMFGGEKSIHKGQLSMDMNLSSPYLLPPGMQGSHDSIHSLARTIRNEQDPYRTVGQYTNSDTGSVRSYGRPNTAKRQSTFTTRSVATSKKAPSMAASTPISPTVPRSPTFPRSPPSPRSPESSVDPFATPKPPKPTHQLHRGVAEIDDSRLPVQPIIPEIDSVRPGDKFNPDEFQMPDLQPPAATASKGPHDVSHSPYGQPTNLGNNNFAGHNQEAAGLGLEMDIPRIMSPSALPHELENGPLYDQHGNQPQIQTSQYYEDYEEDTRGRSAQRTAFPEAQPQKQQQHGLGVPQQGNKRLSVGFRPLPPNEVTESEDPEYRANRIRSFYKEYFDDSKEAPPPMPTQRSAGSGGAAPGNGGGVDYYEDYDENYLGDAAYYDAETNAFIMPYAQPVTRRAMTPPPAGRNRGGAPGGGPRGPHGPHGSLGGMSLPGAPGRARAGSALGPRPGSSASGGWGRGPPRKNLPPPSPLHTLPTPSKLGDDSFALFGATDFAPPDSFREHVAGRSQSPLGERRPYQPKVPVASPLATAFDELAALPSPHMLRKSNTFTNLDFAPPKKFKESDTASDAGSIRSNRSGISAVQLNALRGGAGRVSRLPGDTVFTQAAMDDQLKPSWTMRT